MKEQSFKDQLLAYIHNRLDVQYYESFFDELAEMDTAILQLWIAEMLDQDEGQTLEQIPLPDLNSVHQKVLDHIYAVDPPKPALIRRISLWTWASCAAVLLCILSVLFLKNFSTPAKEQITWYENKKAYTIYAQLPDSSTVILYPHAKIGFEYNDQGQRDVQQVQGRVVYKVHKNKNAPFQVNYKGYLTTALGTIFSVDPRDTDHVLIKLMEGKISVGPVAGDSRSLIYLKPKEEVLVNLNLEQMIKFSEPELIKSQPARADKELRKLIPHLTANVEWSNQSVKFNQTKNVQLLRVIESLYDVSIICDSPDLLNSSFTGSLNSKESLTNFLTSFCQLNGCTFRVDNGIVNISNSGRKEDVQ
ncbi:FecR family protein [Sphingobacterium sp. HMA12]|uniref:FecR family protein n=1 Tax=Sphingobacterium sp. HMA12 TaxID=2050894 RepID=UPI000CE9EB20|nr:FecR family protein [Sphingobacterium sp. HMA12]